MTLQFVADPENILSAGDMPGLEELAPSVMKEPLISQGIMDIGLTPRSQESKGFFPLEGDEPGNNTVSTNDIERELSARSKHDAKMRVALNSELSLIKIQSITHMPYGNL